MSDPTPDFSRMARRLAQALNLPDWEDLSDSEMEHLLETAEPQAISENRQEEILHQTHQLIRQWEVEAMATNRDDLRSESLKRHPVAAGVVSHSPSGGLEQRRGHRTGSGSAVVLAGLALLAIAVLMIPRNKEPGESAKTEAVSPVEYLPEEALRPISKPAAPPIARALVGSTIETGARERRRIALPDGSTLFLNENTAVEVKTNRRLLVHSGEVFVEVVPAHLIETKTPFVVQTPQKSITALGTKFAVKAGKTDTDVLVTQGKVQVTGVEEPVAAGQLFKENELRPAPRMSEALLWTKELMASAESRLIPKSDHAGGALVAIDPSGQEMSLALRKQHIDVHIEDGFARTTIDQTYFNSSWSQLEGTFYFPLPADASLSRLAMYVGENLMEGGMAERDHARNVFEQIRYTRRDPALLEWVDGSTFKMRVFPLEARQEKRIIISYTQRLESAYGKLHYRFPAGHSLELVRDWSTHILVKNHVGYEWASPSHPLQSKTLGEDLVLEATAQSIADDRDLVVELEDDQEANPKGEAARFSRMVHEGQQYLMLRYRPDLKGELKQKPRNWVFLFESAGNRDSLLARVQIEVLETLLKNAEHADTFSVLTAGTRTKPWKKIPVAATPQNIEAAIEHLNEVHLIGALDLGKALTAAKPFVEHAKESAESYLVHLGAGVAVLGEKETESLLRRVPAGAKYVGIGVGKRWSQSFMKEAASRTGGYVTQINPDEEVGWRSFELLSLLNSPRVLKVKVKADSSNTRFLQFSETLAQGEELCAITRLDGKTDLPKALTITGKLQGQAYEKTIPVENIAEQAGYLPRTWAKLEIDRLVASGAEQHKDEIIKLSKAMYVMSPFTSLLVLETEEMYQQFNVDRGRKDHWALYPCPPTIPIVYEPDGKPVRPMVSPKSRTKTAEDLLKTVLVRIPPRIVRANNGYNYVSQGADLLQLYTGAFAAPVQSTQYWSYLGMMPQTGSGGMPHYLYFKELGGASQGRPGLAFSPDGGQLFGGEWDRRSGNVWWDADMDGVTMPPFYPSSSVDGTVIWKGAVTWNAPTMLGSVPLGGEVNPQFAFTTIPSISNFNGAYPGDGFNVALRGYGEGYGGYAPPILGDPFGVTVNDLYTTTEFEAYGLDLGIAPQRFRYRWNDNSGLATLPSMPALRGGFDLKYQFSDSRFDWQPTDDLRPIQLRFIPPEMVIKERIGSLFGNGRGEYRTRGSYTVTSFALQNADEILGFNPQIMPNWSLGRFGDLPAHAPGLNTTSADVQSLLESQGPADRLPKRGQIDPQALALIDRARRLGWEAITLPRAKDQKALTIRCDGQGQFVYDRTISEGLQERVTCDGESLLHLYKELGLAGRRNMSRFHRADILGKLVPWLVPPAEDLAVGCDVKSVSDHAIAVVPISDKTEENKENKENHSASSRVYLLMVFRPDGSLQERQLVDSKTNKPLLTVKYAADGLVEVFDTDNTSLGKANWTRKVGEAPNLEPSLKDIVVLSLPHRSPEGYLSPEQQQLANTNQFLALEEDSARALLGSYHATGDYHKLGLLLGQRYFAKEDYRIGLYVLLASVYQRTDMANPASLLMEKHPNSALAEYLSQHFQWASSGNNHQEFTVKGPDTAFVQRLTTARNLYARWWTGQAVNNRSATEIQIERRRGLESIKKLRSPDLGWLLLKLMQSKDTDPQGLADYIQSADAFAQKPGLEFEARYQAAFWRSEAGQTAESVTELATLSKELLDAGVLPPISEAVRTAFVNHEGMKAWTGYLVELQANFLKQNERHAALLVAVVSAQLKKDALSERLITTALEGLSPEKHPRASLMAAGYLMDQNRFADAEGLVAPLLKAEGWSEQPALWRKASEIAERLEDEALSVARLERAIQLEYESLPDLVNLQKIREDYSGLLSRLEALAMQNAETDLKQRAIRLADRWRVLDPDDTAACQLAARIVSHLGDEALAWDYLTTPLAERPNESAPWLALAQEMVRQEKIDRADRAYREAFAAEATNAQILWDHAEFLRQHDRMEDAQELLEKLAHGTWQPRFENLKTQAQQLLNTNDSKDSPK